MMETQQHVIGKLLPTRPDAITSHTRVSIRDAVTKHQLPGVDSSKWDFGIIQINHSAPVLDGNEAARQFISLLKDFLKEAQLQKLSLRGEITVVATGENPAIYAILVEDNKVIFHHASLQWNEHSAAA